MDPVTLAHQATEIIFPFLPTIYAGKDAVTGKVKDMFLEKGLEKLGSKSVDIAKALLDKIRTKENEFIETALEDLSKNSEDSKAQNELYQGLLKLLTENPDLSREVESIVINFNAEIIHQLAVGNYNTFFYFANPSGAEYIKIIEDLEQRRKEAANQEVMSCYNSSMLPDYPERLRKFVTENRADELRKSLTYLEKHKILLISGVGGVGKSTLARALIDLRPKNVPEPFWFSFYENQDVTLGDILEKLSAYMKAPEIASFKNERREPGKTDVDRLTGELHRRSEIWIFFDDLNTVLEDTKFSDKGIEILFSSLRYSSHNAKIIVTSRILPKFENGESLIDVIEDEKKQHLNGLRTNFAVDYLVKNGLDSLEPDKLKKLTDSVDGHPLALKLLVELVKNSGVDDILEDLSVYQEQKEVTILKARKLFEKLVGEEKGLLERISVYREPVEMKGLKNMFIEKTSSGAIKKLIDKSLLETNHEGKYWLHPLVQEFSYEDLKNKKEVHKFAVRYYLSLPTLEKPAKKEDIQPLIEAHYHACMAEEYDQAFNIIFDNNLYEYLDLWGNYTVLIDLFSKLLLKNSFGKENLQKEKETNSTIYKVFINFYSKLSPKNYFITKIFQKDGRYNSTVFGHLGLIYNDLGEYRKAIEYYEQALKISREIGDRRAEGTWIGNMGNAYSDMGEPRKAIEYYEQALKISRETRDRRGEGTWIGNLGNAYYYLGETIKSIEYYEQALKISRETRDRRGEGNRLGNLGNAYSHLGEYRKAIEYYGQSLKISREIGDRRAEGAWIGNLGSAYSYLGEYRKETEYHEQSLKISREIGDRREEGVALGNLGLTYSNLGEHRKAIEYYEQSLKISREIGDRRVEGITLGNLGLAYSRLGEHIKAIEYYEQEFEINPKNANVLYNEACAYSSMDMKKETLTFLKLAVEIDSSCKKYAKTDKDFKNLWEDKDFNKIIIDDEED
ncbi:tetratricopeptide repeat protein [Methanosarcina sp.]|uniref:tetratricopeptide repeat protein n=1 Tax=Methanosarcina sp. TaxID=2213 RepID=UPI002988F7B4|nr:tetratricopeptide repeat protein [Methanosarcina sp.]MDW5552019.1 tetratricopeptide repeat protein [Methanosarcina sp.]MDW5555798.1 tetratricopeptide repeat protein [Methanosarcina sp.]MDW5561328.1 tetratricopeptide repeat protein [Methanosarcina sp.]